MTDTVKWILTAIAFVLVCALAHRLFQILTFRKKARRLKIKIEKLERDAQAQAAKQAEIDRVLSVELERVRQLEVELNKEAFLKMNKKDFE